MRQARQLILSCLFLASVAIPVSAANYQGHPLAGPKWVATTIGAEPVLNKPLSHVMLKPDGMAGGFGGCNAFHGMFQLEDPDKLDFGPLATTRKLCMEEVSGQEFRFLKALSNTTGWLIFEDELSLLDEDRQVLMTLIPID